MRNPKAALLIALCVSLSAPARASVVMPALAAHQHEAARAPEGQRAGALSDTDREALLAAQQSATQELQNLRAGEIGDHDRQIIGITLLVILVLVIVL